MWKIEKLSLTSTVKSQEKGDKFKHTDAVVVYLNEILWDNLLPLKLESYFYDTNRGQQTCGTMMKKILLNVDERISGSSNKILKTLYDASVHLILH